MKTISLCWILAGALSMAALGCSRVSPDWNGTWKLNEAKSSIPGPTFVITVSPGGEYHYEGGTSSYNFRCDGKDYSTRPNRTLSCVQTGAFVMDTTSKENGAKIATAHWELSADGKMLTISGTSIQADELPKSREVVYSRTSASTGFAGGWRDPKHLESTPPLLLALTDRTLHIAFSGSGQYMDVPLDGSDAPMHGPGVPQGLTMAITSHGSREFLTLKKMAGQTINQGSLRLSADGRTLVEEYWKPSRPDEKASLVYEKQ
jgi:hypothetical protein